MTGTTWTRAAFLSVAAAFFAGLALDIAVPTLVLSLMALANWLVLETPPIARWKGSAA